MKTALNAEKPWITLDASAGSGKTYSLVQHILYKVLSHKDKPEAYQKVLAMTFTNNAAAEMKIRLLNQLIEFAADPTPENSQFFKPVWEQMGVSAKALQRRAFETSRHMLHNYSTLRVGTIDQFTHQLVRTFTRDLDLSDNFEVRLDLDAMVGEALDLLYSTMHQHPDIKEMWVEWVQYRMSTDKSHNPDGDLLKEGKMSLDEGQWQNISKLPEAGRLLEIQKELDAEIDEIVATGRDLSKRMGQLLKDKGFGKDEVVWFGDVQSVILKNFANLRIQDMKDARRVWNARVRDSQDSDFENLLAECQHFQQEKYARLDLLKQTVAKIQVLAATKSLMEKFKELEESQNVMALSVFNKLIYDKLQTEPAAFIYERLGERYWYFYIDEFQDTSVVQFHNLHPLIEHYLTKGDYPNSALIVGDAKQSIYRWRGGHAEQFIDLVANKHPINVSSGHQQYERETVKLGDNYRTYSKIVQFNNDLFPLMSEGLTSPDHQKVYNHEGVGQNPKKSKDGLVKLNYFPEVEGEDFNDTMCQKSLERVNEIRDQGFSLSDIAFLVRSNKQGRMLSSYLVNHNIPVLSADSLILGASFESQLLHACAHLQLKPNDKEQRFKLAYALEKLGKIPGGLNVFEFQAQTVQNGLSYLTTLFPNADALNKHFQSLYHFGSSVFNAFHLLSLPNAMVDAALDLLYTYEQRDGSFAHLPAWWKVESAKKSVVAPDNVEAVRIMTVHKAKGLEFEHVIVPFTFNTQGNKSQSYWIDVDLHAELPHFPVIKRDKSQALFTEEKWDEINNEEWFDYMNVVYVALTRPVQSLHLFFNGNPKKTDILGKFIRAMLNLSEEPQEKIIGQYQQVSHSGTANSAMEGSVPEPGSFSPATLRMAYTAPKDWANDGVDARKWGTSIHRIMQAHPSLRSSALDRMFRSAAFPKSWRSKAVNDVNALEKEVAKYKSSNHVWLAERSLYDGFGEMLKPDAVVIFGQKVWVIDYKTGQKKPEHKDQLNSYISALEPLFEEVMGDLIYL